MTGPCGGNCGDACRARITLVWTEVLDQAPSVITDVIKTTCIDAESDQQAVMDSFCGYPYVSVQLDIWDGPIDTVPLPQWESVQAWELGAVISPDVDEWVRSVHDLDAHRMKEAAKAIRRRKGFDV